MNNHKKKHKTPGVAGMTKEDSDLIWLVFLIAVAAATWAIATSF